MLATAAKEEIIFPLAAWPLTSNSHQGPWLSTAPLYPGAGFLSHTSQPACTLSCTTKAKDSTVVGNNPLSNVDPTGKQGNPVGATCTWDASFQFQSCSGPNNLQFPGCAGCSWTAPPSGLSNQANIVNGFGGEGAAGEQQYLQNVRSVIGWVAGDDPLDIMAYGQTAQTNNEQYCENQNISAVNQVFGLGVSTDNVTNELYRNGAWNFDFSTNAPQSSAAVGRYPLSTFTAVTGIGRSLHLPPNSGPNPGPNVDPSVYGTDSQGNFNFTTHIDSAYSTWHTPIGAAIHGIVDVLLKTNHGC